MDLTLLSGVVRNRRMAGGVPTRPAESFNIDGTPDTSERFPNNPVAARLFHLFERNNICRRFSLRVHKFSFQWDLVLHFAICIISLLPFTITGERLYSFLPLSVWIFYHLLFIIYPRQANLVIPGFGRLKHSFKATIEDFFSPKLLPVLSFSFLLVTLSLAVTGHRLGGPPLCFQPCGSCLAQWYNAVELGKEEGVVYESFRNGCGYANGKEMLAFYTMAQTSFLLFVVVVVAMSVCLAWRIAEEEHEERSEAEESLKRVSPAAFELRNTLIKEFGSPASSIRPEGSAVWIFFGTIAALTFTLLGWHHWYVLPPSHTATLLIVLNLLTILMTTLILHLGFFGRIIALYKRNYLRVRCLTSLLINMKETEIDNWWNCRTFVLNDDLSLDYDIGGLAVSMTFLMNVCIFLILLRQIFTEGGHLAMLEPPGSYCAYACMYVTNCLIKIFTLATNTYEEQHQHIQKLQSLSTNLALRSQSMMMGQSGEHSPLLSGTVQQSATSQGLLVQQQSGLLVETTGSYDEYGNFEDDGPLFIDGTDVESTGNPAAGEGIPSGLHSSHGNYPAKATKTSSLLATQSPRVSSSKSRLKINASNSISHSNLNHSISPVNAAAAGAGSAAVSGGNLLDFNAIVTQNLNSLTASNPTAPANTHPSLANFFFAPTRISNPVGEASSNFPSEPYDDPTNEASQPLLGGSNYNPTEFRSSKDSNEGDGRGRTNGGLSLINPVEISRWNAPLPPLSPAASSDFIVHTGVRSGLNSPSKPPTVKSFPMTNPAVNSVTASTAAITSLSRPQIRHPQHSSHPATNIEGYRQAIAEIISQIRKYDPYPCILGIPVMPALFNGSKFYIFICFVLIGVRTMISCFRQIVNNQ